MEANSKIKAQVKAAPKKPGVYFWLGKKNEILYIGRAVNLKNRLGNYLQANREARIAEMVATAVKIKIVETKSLLEAIILEANSIKKYWPKYNIKDRDNRSFIYIVIPKTAFARPIIIRGQELDRFPKTKADIFGPYQSLKLAEAALKIIRRLFPYSTCKVNSGKPCFDYQIGLCPGACVGAISASDYKKNIANIILLLKGEHRKLMKKLIKENPATAKALKHLQEVSLIERESSLSERPKRIETYDISHLAGKEAYGSMVVFIDGQASKADYRLFKIKDAPAGDDERALAEVLGRRLAHPEWASPDLIVIDGGRPQIDFLSNFFYNKNIVLPFLGISKYGGDQLVFSAKTKTGFKELAKAIKPLILEGREEAHRFVIKAGRRARAIK